MKHFVFCCLILIAGCNTVNIPESYVINVPDGLSTSDVERAIATALEVAKENDNTWSADRTFSGVTWRKGSRSRGWYPEDFRDGEVAAGFSADQYYIGVVIRYDDQAVRTKIVGSRNLKQSDSRIHKRALQRVGQLEDRMRIALGSMSRVNAGL